MSRVLDIQQPLPEPLPVQESIGEARVLNIKSSLNPKQKQNYEDESYLIKTAEAQSGPQAFAIGVGRGMKTISDAVGLTESTDFERRAYDHLKKQRPYSAGGGEIVGEAAPFAIPGTGIGAIPGIVGRTAAATGLGIAEGATIARGRDASAEDQLKAAGIGGVIAGGMEALIPYIGRVGGQIVRRVTGRQPKGALLDSAGVPTPELAVALEQSGISFDELTGHAKELLATQVNASPEEAARLARFNSIGVPATKGDITQDFAQQAQEARLVESSNDVMGDPLREVRLQQSEALSGKLRESMPGDPDGSGEAVQAALKSREQSLRAAKNSLYKQMAEVDPEIKDIPVDTAVIASAVPDADTLEDLAIISEDKMKALEKALVRFGVNTEQAAIDAFESSGGKITPLTVGNYDRFRKLITGIERSDPNNAVSVAAGPITRALDEEADLIDSALRSAGVTDESILAPLKEARGIVHQMKKEFSPVSITGKLINVKPDGYSPMVEASKVWKEIAGNQKPPEYLERTLVSLGKAGPKGKKAIADLQATAILSFIDEAFKAQTRKVKNVKTFGQVAFNNAVEKFGDRRLKALFKDRPDILKRINLVKSVSTDLIPASAAVPKGSASVILDQLNKLGITAISSKLPGMAFTMEVLRTFAEKGKNRTILEKALDARPTLQQTAGFIERDFPGIASAFGIAGFASVNANQKQATETGR